MVVCRFFEQGNCKYGGPIGIYVRIMLVMRLKILVDRCKFEHPRARNASGNSRNPFGAVQNRGSGTRSGSPSQGN